MARHSFYGPKTGFADASFSATTTAMYLQVKHYYICAVKCRDFMKYVLRWYVSFTLIGIIYHSYLEAHKSDLGGIYCWTFKWIQSHGSGTVIGNCTMLSRLIKLWSWFNPLGPSHRWICIGIVSLRRHEPRTTTVVFAIYLLSSARDLHWSWVTSNNEPQVPFEPQTLHKCRVLPPWNSRRASGR